MLNAVWLLPALPLAGFLLLVFIGRRIGPMATGVIATVAVAASFVAAVGLYLALLSNHDVATTHTLFTWIPVGALQVKVAFLVDPLSVTMCLFITFISALIHLYSIGYMKGERDFTKFFVYLNLFVASMLVLVLANNMVLTFVGWEGVGVCSYWLVSFYFERDSAASAGKKAFVYNRIGDVGFLLAMFLIFSRTSTLTYLGIFANRSAFSPTIALLVVLALLFAASGKSAQIPLFNWLPDAMEGPTPVSALIHAATMVTAGVYLLCRMNPILDLSTSGQMVIAIIGIATAFVAATIACAQDDIKKVLAFSTVSQIGYMVLAVGTGAYVAAIFLMVAHAFYKALLFLGSGSVIHGLNGEQNMKVMGGLRKLLPWTYATFLVGWLSITGVPPFSAFWSKGDVLDNVYARYPALWALGLVTALLTGYYMSRLFYLTFTGATRFADDAHSHPHEAPWSMRLPLVLLAIGSIAIGVIDLPWIHNHNLVSFLSPVFGPNLYDAHESGRMIWILSTVDAIVAILGIGIAWILWKGKSDRPELEPRFLRNVWYWDSFYDTIIGRPAQAAARFCLNVVDIKVIDGTVNGVAGVVVAKAKALQKLETGQVRQYAAIIAAGVLALLVFLLIKVH